MQVDVVDIGGGKIRARKRIAHCLCGAAAFRIRRLHVIRIGRLAVTEQRRITTARAAFEQRETSRLAARNAVARHIGRPADVDRTQYETYRKMTVQVKERV